METKTAVQLNTQIWKEGNMYVAHIPLLQLSSCGHTVEEARKNIKEAYVPASSGVYYRRFA